MGQETAKRQAEHGLDQSSIHLLKAVMPGEASDPDHMEWVGLLVLPKIQKGNSVSVIIGKPYVGEPSADDSVQVIAIKKSMLI